MRSAALEDGGRGSLEGGKGWGRRGREENGGRMEGGVGKVPGGKERDF
jgi:hypothetical protein